MILHAACEVQQFVSLCGFSFHFYHYRTVQNYIYLYLTTKVPRRLSAKVYRKGNVTNFGIETVLS